MKASVKSIVDLVGRIHRSEQGAEGLEKLLIIAVIVLPLLGVLIVFRQKISDWASSQWGTVQSDANQPLTTPN